MGVLKYFTKQVYGNLLIYPANQAAIKITYLTGRKTLNAADLKVCEELGFKVERVFEDESEV